MEASLFPPRRKPRVPSPEAPPPGLDRLPPEILEKIVSLLPIRGAVRTSALSRAWRRRWESTADLRFIWRSGTAPPSAIGPVLARYACPVREFRHGWVVARACEYSDEWLRLLAGKGVRSLTLHFAEPTELPIEFYIIDDAVFSCRELTRLDLARCCLQPAPSFFAGFPNLTSLSLARVGLAEHGEKVLEAIIRAAPLLEVVELNDVWINSTDFDEWVISAPNLRSFTIDADHDYRLQIEELPSLQRVSINIDEYSEGRDFVKLFTCFAQITHLEFHMPSAEGNILEGLSCSFQKLKNLILHMCFWDMNSILCMFSLLRSANNLKELEIKIVGNAVQNEELDINFYNTLWRNDLFSALDVITMKDAHCWSHEMHFIEFVLSKARLLREFYVYRDDDDPNSKPSEEAVIELTKYRRVSPKAKVFFRNMDDYDV